MPRKSNELFDPTTGDDAELHADILEEGDHAAAEAVSRAVIRRLIRRQRRKLKQGEHTS